jgi:hypothetical protein
MDKFDRIFQLHAILAARKTPIPLEDLTARLECPKATLYRAITFLKDRLHAPVEFDTEVGASGTRPAAGGARSSFRGCGSRRRSCKRSRSCSDCSRMWEAVF